MSPDPSNNILISHYNCTGGFVSGEIKLAKLAHSWRSIISGLFIVLIVCPEPGRERPGWRKDIMQVVADPIL